jgi:release factor glutamine methyltransferase
MNYHDLRKHGEEVLKKAGIEDYKWDARELLFFAFKIDYNHYLLNENKTPSKEGVEYYYELLEQRAKHIPLQHILHSQIFFGEEFYVDSNVLIPREDTETLVEEAITKLDKGGRLLDLCTGSACILISIINNVEGSTGVGTDISKDALKTAAINVDRFGLGDRIKLLEGDLFKALKDNEKFDMIVSNPPYIRTGDIEGLMPEVRLHDPYIALDGGDDGLYFYRSIIKEAGEYLKDGGFIGFETGNDETSSVMKFLKDAGFKDIEMKRDLSGNPRTVIGRKKG